MTRRPVPPARCPRCGGLLLPDDPNELACLVCGHRAYLRVRTLDDDGMVALLAAIARQARKEGAQ